MYRLVNDRTIKSESVDKRHKSESQDSEVTVAAVDQNDSSFRCLYNVALAPYCILEILVQNTQIWLVIANLRILLNLETDWGA